MEPEEKTSFIAIARIARTRGNRGEVLADLYTDFPNRFDGLKEVWLQSEGGQVRNMSLEDTWEHKGRRVFKFKGVDSISAAEAFSGNWVVIPADQAVQLPEGAYFDHDLVGCLVEDVRGNRLGKVREILRIAGNTQLVVENDGREFLIPAVDRICVEISIREKRILVDPPEGLMDLDK
ncbi:MAG TPA: ribosome maturation factor RimM [Acidobacteriota bacterium]|nr:ribosome maturation factor RimM [Acidobacteriota bacterium]